MSRDESQSVLTASTVILWYVLMETWNKSYSVIYLWKATLVLHGCFLFKFESQAEMLRSVVQRKNW